MFSNIPPDGCEVASRGARDQTSDGHAVANAAAKTTGLEIRAKRATNIQKVLKKRPEGDKPHPISTSKLFERVRNHRCAQPRDEMRLLPKAAEVIATVLTNITGQHKLSAELIKDLLGSIKATTVNSYAPQWSAWTLYAAKMGFDPIPAPTWHLAEFLSNRSQDEKSIANTSKRISAINFFHALVGASEPGKCELIVRTIAGIRRRVSRPVQKRDAIASEDITSARLLAENNNDIEGSFIADLCIIMHEAQLRYSDMSSILLGDIVWAHSHVDLMISGSKTDAYNQGQSTMIGTSTSKNSAYQRLSHCLKQGLENLNSAPQEVRSSWNCYLTGADMAEKRGFHTADIKSGVSSLPPEIKTPEQLAQLGFPIDNLPLLGKWMWTPVTSLTNKDLITPLSYVKFSKALKKLFADCPKYERVGPHSLRRGGTDEKIQKGMDHRLVKFLGRWRSDKAFEEYIDLQTQDRMCALVLQQLTLTHVQKPLTVNQNTTSTIPVAPAGGEPDKTESRDSTTTTTATTRVPTPPAVRTENGVPVARSTMGEPTGQHQPKAGPRLFFKFLRPSFQHGRLPAPLMKKPKIPSTSAGQLAPSTLTKKQTSTTAPVRHGGATTSNQKGKCDKPSLLPK